MSYLKLSHLDKHFGPNHVVKDFSLGIEKGEFISLLGPSGCGKTTVLRMVAGFEGPDDGSIGIDGQDVTHAKSNARNIGMVFQAYALFPNLTVAENVGFGLRVKGEAKSKIAERVDEMLHLIGLPDLGGRYPYQLSGGQQQRVALARALAPSPHVLLLDEPLSALDAKIRVSLRREIREIQRKLGTTTIFVTHDQEEALSMSDRVVVMNNGVMEQLGTAHEVYSQPTTAFVARFVGTLGTLNAEVTDPSNRTVRVAGQMISLPHARVPTDLRRGQRLMLGLRPEALQLGTGASDRATLRGRVEQVEFMGPITRLRLSIGEEMIFTDTFNRASSPPPLIGSDVQVNFSPGDAVVMPS
jgi:putative spermidine/putrescine transport system ATP-binding protein